jgi:myo-inositol-1(or 4)-monophosphatase
MLHLAAVCEAGARAGGEVLLHYQHRIVGREKGPRDLVSDADLASQERIREVLDAQLPGYDFLGEEDDPFAAGERQSPYRWIVDPLDGTTNYVHGLQQFAVVVALERGDDVIAGVVYDPIADECFAAEQGQGAWLNGRRLQTSRCTEAGLALVAASFSNVVPRG